LVRASTAKTTDGLRRFEDDLRDELNVKQIEYLEGGAGLVEYRFKPNLRVVGKKYGKLVPALRTALEALAGTDAAEAGQRMERGETVSLQVDGQTLELQPDEVLVETSSPDGYAVAEENGVLVALNTTLTPELRLEGAARDLVRVIQDARKDAGFEIADRIALRVSGIGAEHEGVSVEALVEQYGAYIQHETLAEELSLDGVPADTMHRVETEIGGVPIVFSIAKR
jgi:isoleucyl-tRNA synthetase